MAFSVITNNAAAIALQSLTSISKNLERTQLNISTGLKVNGPQDDASTFAIAQNQRGEVVCTFTRNMLIPAKGHAVEDKVENY